MDRVETERQLRWLMILRVVTITTLLISVLAVELLLRPGETLRPLFFLAAAAYGLVLVHAALDRWLSGTRFFLHVQLVGDALVVSGFVWITGGLDSPMSFLYLLPIIVASMLLYRSEALAVAGICWALYAALVSFGFRWLPGSIGFRVAVEHEAGRIGYYLIVHLVAFVAVALLASYLSERLRVTGHELAESSGAVARLQALNENIIESINSGLITTDPAGNINFVNRGGMEITGFEPQEVFGRGIEEFFGMQRGYLREVRKQLLAKQRFRFEKYFRRRDGAEIYLGIAASDLYDRAGHPLGYIFIFQDLTEIQALETEVRLKERMAALGEMAAGMAHELRNPLAAISGAVQYLKSNLGPSGETLELMDIILKESQRLDQAIRDFLTFAKPGLFSPERVDVVRLLRDSLKLLRKSREFGALHGIETRFGAPQIWCDLDPNRMKQVFWNLATNALKAMPEGGKLTVEAREVRDGSEVEICFADEGQGMDPSEVEGYFQPFRSSFREGTGLGTAIVYRLVEEHGGKTAVESEPGKGTNVHIMIPSRHPDVMPGREPSSEAKVAGGAAR